MTGAADLRDLYQEMLLDHYRRPRHRGPLPEATHAAEGDNPLCGDKVRVALRLDGNTVRDVAFEGSGCAISTASASLMSEAVLGKRRDEVEDLFARFHALVADSRPPSEASDLGKLEIFAGVREYPSRVKCATLPWHALRAALAAGGERPRVTTEVLQ
jgi:nitrogen fixation NifU-like protein